MMAEGMDWMICSNMGLKERMMAKPAAIRTTRGS